MEREVLRWFDPLGRKIKEISFRQLQSKRFCLGISSTQQLAKKVYHEFA